jgi:thymidylate synthase ThyX
VQGKVPYKFIGQEVVALMPFFTNGNRRVFFIHNLPASITSALLAMYSRLKNKRGLRGHFVDNLLPILLTSFLSRFADRNPKTSQEEKSLLKEVSDFIKDNDLTTLDKFCDFDVEHQLVFYQFIRSVGSEPEYLKRLANSSKIRAFLGMWLDSYGHNSIAGAANLVLGVEDVSILAAKSLEWGRPGAGYIELSTRFVDLQVAGFYRIESELDILAPDTGLGNRAYGVIMEQFCQYQKLLDSVTQDGPREGLLSGFFREEFAKSLNPNEIKGAAFGEACDIAGNILPCATFTSVGISISGESFPQMIKHLYLDATYENYALAEMILTEAEKVGGGHFARHLEVSDWERQNWNYLNHRGFEEWDFMPPARQVEGQLFDIFRMAQGYENISGFSEVIEKLKNTPRGPHDKLPNQFEFISAGFARKMSFRGWRDIHRQGFCTHLRTLVMPEIGFYKYDKPAPLELTDIFRRIHSLNKEIWTEMAARGIPPTLRQYAMAMGNLVGFQIGGNLLQWEFVNWQRTKFSVNHEVRQVVLSIEKSLRERYPWWASISRADMTPAYVCARGSRGVVLEGASQ